METSQTSKEQNNSGMVKRMAWVHGDVENKSKPNNFQHMQSLDKFLQKLWTSMALFGIVFVKRGNKEDEKVNNKTQSVLATLYNVFVSFCLWLCFLKSLASFWFGDFNAGETILRITIAFWSFEVAMNATIMLKTSHPRFGHLHKSCDIWKNKILPLIDELELNMNVSHIRNHLIIATFIGWAVILMNVFLFSFIFFYPHTSYYEMMPRLFLAPIPVSVCTKIIGLVIVTFYTCAWIFPVLHTAALNTILQDTFKACSKALEQANKDKSESNLYPGCLFRQRNLHLDICKIVAIFDRDLKFLYANICSTHICISAFILYHIFKTSMDTFSLVSYVFWLVSTLVILAITCSYAAGTNKAAHSPVDVMYETGTKGMTLDQLGQVNFYLSKLTAAPIGFTVLDFFVITREFILTVGGIFLTYSFVLLQF